MEMGRRRCSVLCRQVKEEEEEEEEHVLSWPGLADRTDRIVSQQLGVVDGRRKYWKEERSGSIRKEGVRKGK
ncbi:hypothetical protein E2C01_059102 [Portunus trituberculatus]|uniref:Uncharacterized protein n=1 Tax=Portunus trituberculatus TaxID=210409 RepID=A0A5B7H566_PORTR|nr:hypothetical protein [Portunus trituberculatus]